MKAAGIALTVLLAVVPARGQSQDHAPVELPGEKNDKPPHDHSRGQRQGFGVPGASGMTSRGDRDRFDMFKDMPEDQKKKVRAAFEKAWKKPEVTEARERLMKANEEYRKTLHDALAETDPEVVKILEKMKPPTGSGGPSMPAKMPDPNDPDFAKKAVQRLSMEFQPPGQGEHRDPPAFRLHERVMQTPAVAEAVKNLQQAEPAKRMEAWAQVHEAYQAAIKSEFARMRENLRKDGPNRNPPDQKNDAPPPDEPR